jgi:hypothetical protein
MSLALFGAIDVYGQADKTLLNRGQDGDLVLQVNDGGVPVNALTIQGTTGKVAIGVDTPLNSASLTVGTAFSGASGISTNDRLVISNTSGSTGVGIVTDDANRGFIEYRGLTTRRGLLGFDSDDSFVIENGTGTDRMYIEPTGEIGIGSSNPADYFGAANKLVVAGTNAGMTLSAGTSDQSYYMFADGSGASAETVGGIRYLHSTDQMDFRVNNNPMMVIESDGDIIMGGISEVATTRLVLWDSSSVPLRLHREDTGLGGVGIAFTKPNTSDVDTTFTNIFGVPTDRTAGAEEGKFTFQTMRDGAMTTGMELNAFGSLYQFGSSFTVHNITAAANDPYIELEDGAGNDWSIRLDDSDGDVFDMRWNNATKFKFDTAGRFGITATTADMTGNDASMTIRNDNGKFMTWTHTGIESWDMRIDDNGTLNFDNDAISGVLTLDDGNSNVNGEGRIQMRTEELQILGHSPGILSTSELVLDLDDDGDVNVNLDVVNSTGDVCSTATGAGLRELSACSSSERYKEEIRDITDEEVERVYELQGRHYRWKPDNGGHEDFGLIAEEVDLVFPELAPKNEEGQPETVNFKHLTGLLVEVVKKQKEEIENLKDELQAIKDHLGL